MYQYSFDEFTELAVFGPVSEAGTHTFTGIAPLLPAGFLRYFVEFYDGYGGELWNYRCRKESPAFFIDPSSPFNAGTAQSTGPLLNCYGNNGIITVTGTSGGEAPYSYSTNGSEFQPSNVFTGVGSQTDVYVRDNRGCTVGPQTVNIGSAPVTLNTTATLLQPETSCTPGSIRLGGLDLSTYAAIMKGSENGPVIIANDPTNSLLVQVQSVDHFANFTLDELTNVINWIIAGTPEN